MISHEEFMVIFRFCDTFTEDEIDNPDSEEDGITKRLAILAKMHEALGFGPVKDCKLD